MVNSLSKSQGSKIIVLKFNSFLFTDCGMFDCDYIKIFDGPTISSPMIGKYTGNSLPDGGVIQSTGNSITVEEVTDTLKSKPGFELEWQCNDPSNPPITDFKTFSNTSCQGTIKFIDISVNNPVSWNWDFGDSCFSTDQNPVHTYSKNGSYTVKLISTNSHGSDTIVRPGYIYINYSPILSSPDTALCDSGSITLQAEGFDHINWYSSDNDSASPVSTLSAFITPKLFSNKSFWVQGSYDPVTNYIGPKDTLFGHGKYFKDNQEHYEIFDANIDFKIISIKVYSLDSGNRTFELQNPDGSLIKDTTVFIPAGSSRITLNFDVPAKMKLRLRAKAFSNLYGNIGNATYPYSLQGVCSIYESDTSPYILDYYYYFYDWELKYTPCKSIKKMITVLIDTMPVANFLYTITNYTVNFQNTSTCARRFYWDFGDGKTDTVVNPIHIYLLKGNYKVSLIAINSCSSDTFSKIIIAAGSRINETTFNEDITIFPNPAKGILFIKIQSLKIEFLELKVINTIGQVIYKKTINTSKENPDIITLSTFKKGIYFFQFSGKTGVITRKIVIE